MRVLEDTMKMLEDTIRVLVDSTIKSITGDSSYTVETTEETWSTSPLEVDEISVITVITVKISGKIKELERILEENRVEISYRDLANKFRSGFNKVMKPSQPMSSDEFLDRCKEIVVDYFNSKVEKTDGKQITQDDVYIVWSVKVLQNNKALVSTNVSDGMYYEITHNGDTGEIYVDAYKKWENFTIN